MSETIKTQKFFIRLPDGKPQKVEGVSINVPFMSDWKFFAWEKNGYWWPTEVRSGGRFPSSLAMKSPEATEKVLNEFCRNRGRAQCEKVFMSVIDKFGDLPVYQSQA